MNMLTEEELITRHCGYLLNSLNEVLNGFRVDFDTALKVRREDVSALYEKLDHRCRAGFESAERDRISSREAYLLLKCSLLCSSEFDGSEFETRLGESQANAQSINETLELLANRI